MSSGRVLLLEGPSSAGKTAIATTFRDVRANRGELWLLVGIDDVLSRLPAPWVDVGWPSGPGELADQGLGIVDGPDGPTIRVGRVLRTLLRIHQAGVARAAHAGIDVVADEVVFDEQTARDWRTALDGLDVRWVRVSCDPEELQRRQRARDDRPTALAMAQLRIIPSTPDPALRLDTTGTDPVTSARALDAFVERWPPADADVSDRPS